MKEEIQTLLEDILVAETLILSELIRQGKERGTTRHRVGGDYTADAVRAIKESRQKVIALLQR